MMRDPLIHFLMAGMALFAVFAWRGVEPPPERIVISAATVERLLSSAALLEGRPPTGAELGALVEPVIRDEVYYREALALGLDVDDDEVRRRLIEKMRYLSQDLADPEPPSADALRAFYSENPERFRVPAAVTLDQVFFSPERRGAALDTDAVAALTALVAGADPATVGDRAPLQRRFVSASRERLQALFGDDLASAAFEAGPGRWIGPFRSGFGLHLTRVVERSPARLPPYTEIAEQVRAVYAEAARQAANEAAYERIASRYDIVVEWPASGGQASRE